MLVTWVMKMIYRKELENLKAKGVILTFIILAVTSCNAKIGISTEETASLTNSPTTITVKTRTPEPQETSTIVIELSITPSPPPTKTRIQVPQRTSGTCPSVPTTITLENGLTWTEFVIPDRDYYHVKSDVSLLESCIDFPTSNNHDNVIFSDERIKEGNGSNLISVIGGDTYRTEYDTSMGCCEYDLLKNDIVIYHINASFITTDPNRHLLNVGEKLVWELLAQPPVIIVDGINFNEEYQLDGSYYPYEVNDNLIYIAKKNEAYQIVYEDEAIGPAFDAISKAYCCGGMSVIRGGGQYWFIGKRDDLRYVVLIQ